jgi:hypothetical protein
MVQIPFCVSECIKALDQRNRLIRDFQILEIEKFQTRNGLPAFRLKLLVGDSIIWSACRKTVESQLIDAGCCTIDWNSQQMLTFLTIVKKLGLSWGYDNLVEINLSKDTCLASIRGFIDQALEEGLISKSEYTRLIADLGKLPNRFSKDFEWYFGTQVPGKSLSVNTAMNSLKEQLGLIGYSFYEGTPVEALYLVLEALRNRSPKRYSNMLTVVGRGLENNLDAVVLAPKLAFYGLNKFVGQLLSDPVQFRADFKAATLLLAGETRRIH